MAEPTNALIKNIPSEAEKEIAYIQRCPMNEIKAAIATEKERSMLAQNYTCLRDAQEKDLSSKSLTGTVTTTLHQEHLYESAASLEALLKLLNHPQWPWTHCHGSIHHSGQQKYFEGSSHHSKGPQWPCYNIYI
jgi:hypothetical protein